MDDVVVHYKPSSGDLKTIIDSTERTLAVFPCRVLPPFIPWYPSNGKRPLPIRPSKAPPVITRKDLVGAQTRLHSADLGEITNSGEFSELTRHAQQHSNTGILFHKEDIQRSWCVAKQQSLLSRNPRPLSKQFLKVVWTNRLHLRQRVKWLVYEHNCATAGDLEQVWTVLNLAIKTSKLPTCNANIRRDLKQIWVFCDVLHCEYIGKYLKEKFKLTGNITLSVHKQGDIFSF
ncbi:shieldin complex subunit 3 [Aplochiton taeniatus]